MAKRLDLLRDRRERLKLEIETQMLQIQKDHIQARRKKARHYEGASRTERMSKWRVPPGRGPNTILRSALRLLRERCRDLVRNNPLGESAASVMVSGIVGTGIEANIKNKRLAAAWNGRNRRNATPRAYRIFGGCRR